MSKNKIFHFGKVGIKNTNPSEMLQIGDGSGTTGGLKVAGQSSSVTDDGLTLDWTASNEARLFSESSGNSTMQFYTTNSGTRGERLRIESDGKTLIERSVTSTSGVHPALQIETTTNGSAISSFATGIDFFQNGIHKKRLGISKGNLGTGGGDWVFYKDQGNNVHTYMFRDGDMSIVDGNLKLASGHGINFHNYGSGSNISSNKLDDYEEGSHNFADASLPAGNLSITNNNTGKYTKIGRMVYITFDITYPSNTDNNTSRVTSPFAASTGYGGGWVGWNDLARPMQVHVSGTNVYFMDNTSGGSGKHLFNYELSGKRFIGAYIVS